MAQEKSETRRLAEWIAEASWEGFPEEVRRAVKLRVLDLVSVSLGACREPLIQKVLESYSRLDGQGPCSVWGTGQRLPMAEAAKVNAMLAHTLELDDVHPASKTHGSASIIPAAWAAAQFLSDKERAGELYRPVTGREFLTAVVCGLEVTARIGMALGASAYRKKGWHATATCGIFGCAAAASKLLGLSAQETVWALGMAGTQSSGLWAFLGDGASCKVLHTAHSAACGLDSAFLAKAGMTGAEHILIAQDGGLLSAMSDSPNPALAAEGLGQRWEILNMDLKPYPCCRSTHCIIDAVLRLRERPNEENIAFREIQEINVDTYEVGWQQCAVSTGCKNPQNSMDARFSAPYCAAAALVYGNVTQETFDDGPLWDREVRRLLSLVHIRKAQEFTERYPAHWGCRAALLLTDGRLLKETVQDARGSAANPLTEAQLKRKAWGLIGRAYPGKEEKVAGQLLGLADACELPWI